MASRCVAWHVVWHLNCKVSAEVRTNHVLHYLEFGVLGRGEGVEGEVEGGRGGITFDFCLDAVCLDAVLFEVVP